MNDKTAPRKLGTSDIPGATTQDGQLRINVEQNAPRWVDAAYSAGAVWVGFDANGKIVVIEPCEEGHSEDSPEARDAVRNHPQTIVFCDFVASQGVLHYSRCLSVLTGNIYPGDPTLGLDGEITYGNGKTARYIRGVSVNSAHEEIELRRRALKSE